MKHGQQLVEALQALSELLSGFAARATPFEDAKIILETKYAQTELAELLEQYHQDAVVFEDLLEDPMHDELLCYFCHLNPNIITVKLYTDPTDRRRFLQLIVDEEHDELLTWLEEHHPDIMTQHDEYLSKIKGLEKNLRKCIKRGKFEVYQQLLAELTSEELLDLLTLDDIPRVLAAAFKEKNVSYLHLLISRDVTVLRIDFDGDTVLTNLCHAPTVYAKILEFIKQKYADVLTPEELEQLSAPHKPGDHQSNGASQQDAARASSQAAPKPPLLTTEQIDALSEAPLTEEDTKLMGLVNTDDEIDIAALDAFLFQTLRSKLATKNIALMPTIRSVEAIGVEQLQDICARRELLYTTQITVNHQEIRVASEVQEHLEVVLGSRAVTHDVDVVAWPVYLPNRHYGLLMLRLRQTNDPSSAYFGFYFEPINKAIMLHAIYNSLSEEVRHRLDAGELDVNQIARGVLYRNYVQRLCATVQPDEAQFKYVFLSQSLKENYCSDYVIAVLALLASGDIDFRNAQTLHDLPQKRLDENAVRHLRMLQIKLFGPDYLWLQLPARLKTEATALFLKQIKSHPEALSTTEEASTTNGAMVSLTDDGLPTVEECSSFTTGSEKDTDTKCRAHPTKRKPSDTDLEAPTKRAIYPSWAMFSHPKQPETVPMNADLLENGSSQGILST